MDLLTIFKEHKLLLGATAILSVGSVAAACATGGASIAAIPVLASFTSSLLSNIKKLFLWLQKARYTR